MDEYSKNILNIVGINIDNEMLISRDILLDGLFFLLCQEHIKPLKKILSSSALTSLQKNSDCKQKFPLLNLVRQILNVYGYKMTPIKKSNGYVNGTKKYIRYFLINKKIELK